MSSGLIASQQTRPNTTDSYYVRKGEALSDPLVIESQDGNSTAVIGCGNNGNIVMYPTNPAGATYIQGNGGLFINSPNNNNILQLGSENDGDALVYQTAGSTLYLGRNGVIAFQDLSTAPFLRVGAGQGRIYDSVYNKPFTVTTLQIVPTVGNITYDNTSSVPAGLYQLQLTVETLTATGGAGNFLSMYVTLPPSTDVVNFSGNQIAPSAVGTSLLCLNSGYFSHPGGNMRVELNATTPWTGSWTLQLVKMG
jgi:hypothetical protein